MTCRRYNLSMNNKENNSATENNMTTRENRIAEAKKWNSLRGQTVTATDWDGNDHRVTVLGATPYVSTVKVTINWHNEDIMARQGNLVRSSKLSN